MKIKENMIDVLMYLFENYMEYSCEINCDQKKLIIELEKAGFSQVDIHKALRWLDDLSALQIKSESIPKHLSSVRVFTQQERLKLGFECCSFIYFLENIGALNSVTRELVIDRAMALDHDFVDFSRLKWVILMVLFNAPGQEAALAWMEDYVLTGKRTGLH